MANQKLIDQWLTKPDLLTDADILVLKQIHAEQPFFQPAYFLLLAFYKKNNHWEYEKLLKQSAIHIFDRRRLFIYLHKPAYFFVNETAKTDVGVSLPKLDLVKDQSIESSVMENEIEEIHIEVVSESRVQTSDLPELEPQRRDDKDTLEEALSDTLQQQTINNIQVQEKSILPDFSFELDENFEIVKPDHSQDFLIANMTESAVSNEILHIEEKEEIQNQVENTDLALQAVGSGVLIDMHEELPDDSSLFIENTVDNEHESIKDRKEALPFTEWLDQIDVEKLPENEKESNKEISSGKPSFDLIDKFLNEDPRIKAKPFTDSEQPDISESSVEEHEDFITDTLAKIYLKQGNFAKAILAYEKLSLKFPEKSTYFASQINEIKKLINNQ